MLYVLSYVLWCDCHIRVDFSTESCACPLFGVFLAELGLIPFNLELTFTFLSLRSVGTSRTHSLTLWINHTLATNRVILLAFARQRGQGITLRPTTRTPTPNGLRSNWDFSLGRCPWHAGGSSTINIYGARRRAKWQAETVTSCLNLLPNGSFTIHSLGAFLTFLP